MKNNGIFLSAVITTYNRAGLVSRAIESVFAQRRPADEVIVIDDGSTDDTHKMIKHNYPKVRYIRQENQGISAARNLGIAEAQFDWIAFLDSDDAWLPQKLTYQIDEISAHREFKLGHTNELWIRHGRRVNPMKKHRKYGGHIYLHCLPLCIISPSSVIMHRELFQQYGLFDTSLPACEDYDMWLRLCAFEPVLYLDKALIKKYGGHSDQLSQKHWGMDRFRIKSLIKMIEAGNLSPAYLESTRKMLAKKLHILHQGAKKRGKTNDIAYYSTLINKYAQP
jgi:glycosyltransferase involved in cell wall biosynthesis